MIFESTLRTFLKTKNRAKFTSELLDIVLQNVPILHYMKHVQSSVSYSHQTITFRDKSSKLKLFVIFLEKILKK